MNIKPMLLTIVFFVAILPLCDAMELGNTQQNNSNKILPIEGQSFNGLPSDLSSDLISSFCVHPDGKRFVVGFRNENVALVDMKTGAMMNWKDKGEPNLFRVTPGGEYVVGVSNCGAIVVRNCETGTFIRSIGEGVYYETFTVLPLGQPEEPNLPPSEKAILSCLITGLCVAPSGNDVYVGSSDGRVRVWEIETGKCVKTFNIGENRSVENLWVSSQGTNLFGECDKNFFMLKQNEKVRKDFSPSNVFCVTSDERYLILGCVIGTLAVCQDFRLTNIIVWDIKYNNLVHVYLIPGHLAVSLCSSVSNSHIISGSLDGRVRIWELMTGKVVFVSSEYSGPISHLELIFNGNSIAFFVKGKMIVVKLSDLICNNLNGNSTDKTEKQVGSVSGDGVARGKRKRDSSEEEEKFKRTKNE